MIRTARLEDAERLAWVHIRSWQQAYAGLLPADYLDNLMDELPRRTERWRTGISSAPPWVAESDVGEVFGFAAWGASQDDDATFRTTGEVYGIYLLAQHWSTGAGRRLMEAALSSLKEAGFAEATLWVLDRNVRARRFYEAGGWVPDGATKIDQREGFVLSEVRYRRRLNRGPGSDVGGEDT